MSVGKDIAEIYPETHAYFRDWMNFDDRADAIEELRIILYHQCFFLDDLTAPQLDGIAELIASNGRLDTIDIRIGFDSVGTYSYGTRSLEGLKALATTVHAVIESVGSSRPPIETKVTLDLGGDDVNGHTFDGFFLSHEQATAELKYCLEEFVATAGAVELCLAFDGVFDESFIQVLENHVGAADCLRKLELGGDKIYGNYACATASFSAASLVPFLGKQKNLENFRLRLYVNDEAVRVNAYLRNDDLIILRVDDRGMEHELDGRGMEHEIKELLAVLLLKTKVMPRVLEEAKMADPVTAVASLLSHSGSDFITSQEIREKWHESCCSLAQYGLAHQAIAIAIENPIILQARQAEVLAPFASLSDGVILPARQTAILAEFSALSDGVILQARQKEILAEFSVLSDGVILQVRQREILAAFAALPKEDPEDEMENLPATVAGSPIENSKVPLSLISIFYVAVLGYLALQMVDSFVVTSGLLLVRSTTPALEMSVWALCGCLLWASDYRFASPLE